MSFNLSIMIKRSSYHALCNNVLPKLYMHVKKIVVSEHKIVMLHGGKSHTPFVSEQAHNIYCSIMVKSSMPAHNEALH